MRICSIATMHFLALPLRQAARSPHPQPFQEIREAFRLHLLHSRSGEHYDVKPAEPRGVVTKTLPDPALQPMANHREGHDATRDGETEPGMAHAVGSHDDRHDPRIQADAAAEGLREVLPPPQPTLGAEAPIGEAAFRQRA